MLNYLPVVACIQDLNFQFEFCNTEFLRKFGNQVGVSCKHLFSQQIGTCQNCPSLESLETNSKKECEWKDLSGNQYILFTNSIIEMNGVKKILKMGIDISDKNQLNENLKKLNNLKNKFISIIAHDLRNPFHGIINSSKILLDNLHTIEVERMERNLLLINQTAKDTFNLLENLLTWAKFQYDPVQLDKSEVDVTKLVNECISLIKTQAFSKRITVTFHDLTMYMANTDKNMLGMILRNLISNAIKFTKKNGFVEITVTQEPNFLVFRIQDTGVGMDTDMLNGLFSIQKKTTTLGTAQETGTGLGLVLCKEFVDRLGGEIWAESDLGKGSTFYLKLPGKIDS